MNPYWAKFQPPGGPSNLNLGVGVTARSEEDARRLLERAFPEAQLVNLTVVSDASELDQKHVVPNMGNLLARGIWFPVGFEQVASDIR